MGQDAFWAPPLLHEKGLPSGVRSDEGAPQCGSQQIARLAWME